MVALAELFALVARVVVVLLVVLFALVFPGRTPQQGTMFWPEAVPRDPSLPHRLAPHYSVVSAGITAACTPWNGRRAPGSCGWPRPWGGDLVP